MLDLLITILLFLGLNFTTTKDGKVSLTQDDYTKLTTSDIFRDKGGDIALDDIVIVPTVDPEEDIVIVPTVDPKN
jgi:hypothetical protein